MNNQIDNYTNKKEINQTSSFFSEFNKEWLNLFFYKNNFLNELVLNNDVQNILKNNSSNFYFIYVLKSLIKNINDFKLIVYLLNNTVGDQKEFEFDINTTSSSRILDFSKTFVQDKDLLVKIKPGLKVKLTIENIEDMFLKKGITEIDFSKNIFQNKNFTSFIKNVDLNNPKSKELFQALQNIQKSLLIIDTKVVKEDIELLNLHRRNNKERYNYYTIVEPLIQVRLLRRAVTEIVLQGESNKESRKKELIDAGKISTRSKIQQTFFTSKFSSTIGFSIKSTSLQDFNAYNYKKNNENLPVGLEKIHYEDFVQNFFFKNNNDLKVEVIDIKSDNKSLDYLNKIKYTKVYFSPFEETGENTFLKRKYETTSTLEIKKDSVKLKKIKTNKKHFVSFINQDDFQKLNSNIKGMINFEEIKNFVEKDNHKLKSGHINKKYEYNLNIIKKFEFINDELVITLEYIKLNKFIKNSKIFQDYYLNNEDKILFYDPEIRFETINRNNKKNILTLNDENKNESEIYFNGQSIQYQIDEEINEIVNIGFNSDSDTIDPINPLIEDRITIGYFCINKYKVNIDEIINSSLVNIESVIKEGNLRSLSNLYNKKFFYFSDNTLTMKKGGQDEIYEGFANIFDISALIDDYVKNNLKTTSSISESLRQPIVEKSLDNTRSTKSESVLKTTSEGKVAIYQDNNKNNKPATQKPEITSTSKYAKFGFTRYKRDKNVYNRTGRNDVKRARKFIVGSYEN